jgi:hypothetical protein
MRHDIVGALPSLVLPLLMHPALAVVNDHASIRIPPYPEIDFLQYGGFHVPHLRWIGVRAVELPLPELAAGEVKQSLNHEHRHAELALLPFSRLRNHEGIIFYERIVTTFDEGKDQIPVPLHTDLLRNDLEKQWDRVVRFTRASQVIEEVYAVRSSLLWARDEGLIEPDDLPGWIADYKNGYGVFIPGYAAVYTLFDFVARNIGETAADGLINTALSTIDPQAAFVELLFYLCLIGISVPLQDFLKNPSDALCGWALSEEETASLKTASRQQAYQYFYTLLDELDPDDTEYRRKEVINSAAMVVTQQAALSQLVKDEIAQFILAPLGPTLFSSYSDYYIRGFHKTDVTEKGEVYEEIGHGNLTILLEAIRQQLTQGKGLLCPFWLYTAPHCCSDRNRALLENVWQCTSKSSCKLWQRMGCLGKAGGRRVKRARKNTTR